MLIDRGGRIWKPADQEGCWVAIDDPENTCLDRHELERRGGPLREATSYEIEASILSGLERMRDQITQLEQVRNALITQAATSTGIGARRLSRVAGIPEATVGRRLRAERVKKSAERWQNSLG